MSHVERRRVGCCSRAWSAACSCAKRLSAGRSNVNCRNAQSSSETTFRVQHSCDGRLHGATCSCAVRYAMNPNAWIQCGRVMHLQVGLPDCACVRCCNRSLYARCRNRMTCVCVGIGRCRPWRCSLAYSADQVSALVHCTERICRDSWRMGASTFLSQLASCGNSKELPMWCAKAFQAVILNSTETKDPIGRVLLGGSHG